MDRINVPQNNKKMMYLLVFIIIVGIILFFYINPKRKIVENSKQLYKISIDKMNTSYGKAKKEAEESATNARYSWDANLLAIYKIIIEYLLFILAIVFNLYNPFSKIEYKLSATMGVNFLLLGAILFEYFTDVIDTFFKDNLHSIDSVDEKPNKKVHPNLQDNYHNKLLVLLNTVSIGIFSIMYMVWYHDNLFIVYALISYILSLFTLFDVPGFASEFYIFILYFILNIPMVTMTVAHLNIPMTSTTHGVYIPLLIAFYILTIIALTTLGIVDIYNTDNVFVILGLIGISFLYHAQTLTNSIYRTFLFIVSMIMLFIVVIHYIIIQYDWILYMVIYSMIIIATIYFAPKPNPALLGRLKPAEISKEEIGLLAAEIIFILAFIYIRTINKKIYTTNGYQIINNPVSLEEYNNITLKEKPTYDYGISFWVYIQPMNPGSAPQATEYTTILSYGGKPRVSYNGVLNTMQIEIKTDGKIGSKPVSKIVANIKSFPLQKWNHVVLNYVNGTCDIFMNGELHSTQKDVIPIKESESIEIGTKDGIRGSLCNIILFNEQLSASGIKALYHQFSGKNPPTI
jgi:hypothetical protein